MPFIDFKVSCEVSKQKEEIIKSALGDIITEIPGKTESRLMIEISDNCKLWYAGTEGDSAFINIMVYGASTPEAYKAVADRAINLVSDELSISKNRIYLKFEEVPNWYWG